MSPLLPSTRIRGLSQPAIIQVKAAVASALPAMLRVHYRMVFLVVSGLLIITLVSSWPSSQKAGSKLKDWPINADRAALGQSHEIPDSSPRLEPAGNYADATVVLGGNTVVVPASAPAGITSLNASTNASFQGVLSADPVTGVVRITNAYPKGTYTVTVRGFNGGGAVAPQTFILTVQQGTNCSPVFAAAPNVTVGNFPRGLAVGDFNGDGRQDFAAATNSTVSIRLGDGSGGFSGTTEVAVDTSPAVAVGDLNNDGKQDLAIGNTNSSISIRLGDGAGGFTGNTNVPLPAVPESIAIADFNNDGKLDLAATSGNGISVWIRLGNGVGSFSGTTEVTVGQSPRAVAIGDFNNDGNQDLATANFSSNTASVRLGDGAGGFSGTTEVSAGSGPSLNPNSVAISDFNNDGKQDLILANFNGGSVAVRLGDGAGNFSGTTTISVAPGLTTVVTADFNNDGNQDFAVNGSGVQLYTGNGAGNFALLSNQGGGGLRSLAIGDFNGDSKQDFIDGTGFTSVVVRLGLCNTTSTTAVTSSVNPSDFGENVIIKATVTSNAGTPTGTVQFKVNGSNVGSPANLAANGSAQLGVSGLPPGTHAITAEYGGDANFFPSTGSLPGGQVVRPQPSLSINDVTVSEGDTGTRTMSFTVTLSAASNLTVTVNFQTTNGTATEPSDYQSTNGTLNFSFGARTRTVSVVINGDTDIESDETLKVNLTGATNATISKSEGVGTIQNDDGPPGVLNFSQANYSVAENTGFLTINVERTNGAAVSVNVDYATDDSGAPSACNQATGSASSRCDFTRVAGTLAFASGETQKTFTVLVSRDSYVEGPETFTLRLSNPTGGATLGANGSSIVTVTDVPTGPPANAIDDAAIFVRMHYHDFLNREGDQSGIDFWTGQMTNCGASDLLVCRVNVSGAFFLSIEFQQTGYLVERMYRTAYGQATATSTLGGSHQVLVPVVRANEFLADTQRIGRGVVVLQPGWEQVLENNKQAYALEFVQTSRFITALPTSRTPTQFVDQLNQNAGLVLSASERTIAINTFGGAGNTTNVNARAQVLRQIAEDQDLFNAEFNRAFVLAEYIGYLRRNPNDAPENGLDYTGYEFWLTKLNENGGDYIKAEMVKAFIASDEYRKRFGP